MKSIGEHQRTEVAAEKDINGRFMVGCLDCGIYAHASDIPIAETHLAITACAPNCANCKSLRDSYNRKPAVPKGGSCNDILHVCPNDGIKWWQSNDYFHLWQEVTDPKEWESLCRQYGQNAHVD